MPGGHAGQPVGSIASGRRQTEGVRLAGKKSVQSVKSVDGRFDLPLIAI
jgi:hypothetical protein